MKTKSFQKYLEKRLDKKEIKEIKRQAKIEAEMLRLEQNLISQTHNKK